MSDRTVSPPLRVTETHRSPHTLRAPSALSCKSYSPAIVSKLWTTCLLGGHGRRPVAHLPSHTGEGNYFPTKKSFSCETTFSFFIEPLMSRWRVRRRSPRGLLGTGRRRPGFRRRIEPRGARALPGPASVGEPAHCRSTHMLRPQHLPPGMSVDLQLGFCSWSRLPHTCKPPQPSTDQRSRVCVTVTARSRLFRYGISLNIFHCLTTCVLRSLRSRPCSLPRKAVPTATSASTARIYRNRPRR